ncbi:hypothetical protein Btru_046651 [Bulinus truncatus]|nr:hypothetical protein Btru_046651 [Bulinus truncatus]
MAIEASRDKVTPRPLETDVGAVEEDERRAPIHHSSLIRRRLSESKSQSKSPCTVHNNLSFYNNSIDLAKTSELSKIFEPLVHLTELNLMYNKQDKRDNISYIFLESLTKLYKLSLEMNMEMLYFGPEFLKLKNLKHLEITGFSRILSGRTFENVDGLQMLSISSMQTLSNISQDVFVPLHNLSSLFLHNLYFPVQYILSLLKTFEGRNMSEINFDLIGTSLTVPISVKDGYITENDTQHLTNICVKNVSITNCNIYFITQTAFRTTEIWHRCLSNIDLSYNPIQGDRIAYITLLNYRNVYTFKANELLRICNRFPEFPQASDIIPVHKTVIDKRSIDVIPINNTDIDNRSIDVTSIHKTVIDYSRTDVTSMQNTIRYNSSIDYISTSNKDRINDYLNYENNITFIFQVSDKLKTIIAREAISSSALNIDIKFVGAENLEHLDLSDSILHTFTGSIHGLTSIKTAILSGNGMSQLSVNFFDPFPTLENLALAKCQLDASFFSLCSKRVFQNLTLLKQLDLSFNYLRIFNSGTFLYNSKLQRLSLSGNQFREIPFDLKHTPELQELDMSNNAITTISQEKLNDLDHLRTKSGQFILHLGGNILSCGCSDLYFLQWMRHTKVTLDQGGNFTCINKDGVLSYSATYSDLDLLWRECWGQFYLYLALIILCLYSVGFMIVLLILRNKRYLVSYIFQILGNFRLLTRDDYNIGVFVGYAEMEYRFPCGELRHYIENSLKLSTFINDRDLLPSLDKASGVVDAINKSWRIVLVCGESFLSDDWSMFIMRSSIYAQSPANSSRVVVMVHQSCVHKLPTELLSAVNDENIIVVSEWELTYDTKETLETRLMVH